MTSKPAISLPRQLLLLCGGTLLLWGLAVVPARFVWGEPAVWNSGVAALLCLLPAVATFLWAQAARHSSEGRLVAMLGGSGLRMALVLAGGFGLTQLLPEWFSWSFWIWLMVFYAFTLGVETTLIVLNARAGSQ